MRAATVQERLNLFSAVNRMAVSFYNANPRHTHMAPIDLNDDEVYSFLKTLQELDVKYLLVGGFAMAFHGFVRATNDLDLWIKYTPENISKLKTALMRHGMEGLDKITEFERVPGVTEFRLGSTGFIVEPFKALKAFKEYDFDACYERADAGTFKGLHFRVLERKDLLKEKKATNRPKDQGDIEFLEGQ